MAWSTSKRLDHFCGCTLCAGAACALHPPPLLHSVVPRQLLSCTARQLLARCRHFCASRQQLGAGVHRAAPAQAVTQLHRARLWQCELQRMLVVSTSWGSTHVCQLRGGAFAGMSGISVVRTIVLGLPRRGGWCEALVCCDKTQDALYLLLVDGWPLESQRNYAHVQVVRSPSG